jgi:hypothetical protein
MSLRDREIVKGCCASRVLRIRPDVNRDRNIELSFAQATVTDQTACGRISRDTRVSTTATAVSP